MDNTTLTHWGIKGMRWGIRRYQNKDGSLTKAGKKRYGESEDSDKPKKSYEEQKQDAVKSGSAAEVLKFKGDLSQQEMQTAINRIRWEHDMQSIADKDVAVGQEKVNKFFGNVEKATDYAVTSAKAYNMFANVYNAFSGTDKVSLPKIDTDVTKGNKETRRQEKKKLKEAAKENDSDDANQSSDSSDKKTKTSSKSSSKNSNAESSYVDFEVVGEGTSGKKSSGKKSKPSGPVIIDMPVSSAKNSPEYAIGQRYVSGLLEAPKDDD